MTVDLDQREKLDCMFHPRGVAVFGAVHEPAKFGHMMLQTLIRYGYSGRLYPVQSQGGEVYGLRVYRSLGEVEGPVDLACVCVPAAGVPGVLRECLARGVAGAQVLTSGFAETGEAEGMALQRELTEIASRGIRVLGPNCFGAHVPRGGITLIPGYDFAKDAGPVALISQSGGVATDFGHEARMAGFGVSKIISFGNGCDLDAVELLDYLTDDLETGYVAAYLEGVKDGSRFRSALGRLTRKKPVVIWKGGLTPLGGRAAMSHTGSLGGESRVWDGVLTQTGAIPVQGLEELVDTLTALVHRRRPGRRIALLGGGGAIGVFSSDLAHRWGLEIPTFTPETRQRLRGWLATPGNSVANPLDTGTPVLPLDVLAHLTDEVLVREPVDVLVLILHLHPLGVVLPEFMEMDGLPLPSTEAYLDQLLEVVDRLKGTTGKDVVLVMENRANRVQDLDIERIYRRVRLRFQGRGISVFPTTERALRAIRNAASASGRFV
jgi:acyl-CoA synthetase (NDP forming)